MPINTSNTVFVFDLDDTLYKEMDYFKSGVNAVIQKVLFTYGLDVESYLNNKIATKPEDLWGDLCRDWCLPSSVKDSLIWEYRLHIPEIKLSSGVKELLEFLEKTSAGVVILTDGRSVTQRLKVKALGISHLPCFISEEHGEIKPDPLRFNEIEKIFLNKDYIYLGDNIHKDFLAPNKLGWITFCIEDDGRNIHKQDLTSLSDDYLPSYWLSKLEELKNFLC